MKKWKNAEKNFFGPITGHFLAKIPDFGRFWKNLKNYTTFTKMVLRSPNMAKNQLWDISKLFYGMNFLFRSKFRFYCQKKPIFVKKWLFWPFFGSFSAPRMSKNQIKQNSTYKNLTNNVYKLFGPPHRGWDLWFSLRSSVRPFVTERSQNPFIGIFWFLAESWGFLMQRKWHFQILAQNPVLAILALLCRKMAIFGKKSTF